MPLEGTVDPGLVWTSENRVVEVNCKFYPVTELLLSSLRDQRPAEFPFELTEEELEILRHEESGSVILGRSGTGKTTCMVYQLLRNHLAHKDSRQILVTRSPVLARKLATHARALINSHLRATQLTEDEFFQHGADDNIWASKTLFNLPAAD